jgi:hypothetical protein
MPIDINGTVLSGGSNFSVTDQNNNKLLQETSGGQVLYPTSASGSPLMPLFNVGFNANGWNDFGASGNWYVVPWTYTLGDGYYNVGNCYNPSTYAFTAPWTGMYLFKQSIYIYCVNGSVYNYYTHNTFWVNGGFAIRRPLVTGAPYRIRQHGFYGSYGHDTDCCEMIYLTAGDYVEARCYVGSQVQGYGNYSTFSGVYLGS